MFFSFLEEQKRKAGTRARLIRQSHMVEARGGKNKLGDGGWERKRCGTWSASLGHVLLCSDVFRASGCIHTNCCHVVFSPRCFALIGRVFVFHSNKVKAPPDVMNEN